MIRYLAIFLLCVSSITSADEDRAIMILRGVIQESGNAASEDDIIGMWIVPSSEELSAYLRCSFLFLRLNEDEAKKYHKKVISKRIVEYQSGIKTLIESQGGDSKKVRDLFKPEFEILERERAKINRIRKYRYMVQCQETGDEKDLWRLLNNG